jgi:hypothetical protein
MLENMHRLMVTLVLALSTGCHLTGEAAKPGAPTPEAPAPQAAARKAAKPTGDSTCGGVSYERRLRATLVLAKTDYAAAADVEVDVALENISDTPVEVDAVELVSQPLLLEVRDSADEVVSAGPPPMPSERMRVIAPHETVHTKLDLGPFGFQRLPPGEYRVCARGLASNTLSFRIAGGP